MTAEEVAFFAGHPEALALWLRLKARLADALDTYCIRAGRTQLSLYSGCMFACLSFPRRAQGGCLLLTLGLPFRLESPRVWQVVEPYPGRWTHHIPLAGENDLDDELMEWLSAAQKFAQAKRKR